MVRPYDAGDAPLPADPGVFGARFAPMAAQCPYATDAPAVCCGEKRSCGDRSDHAAFCEEHRQTLLGLQAAPPAELHGRDRAPGAAATRHQGARHAGVTAARALVCNETWKVGRGYRRIAEDIPACAV